jgi:REP element-mobilizing transposase RayT
MAIRRDELVDFDNPGVYHCISRCVRRALLCGEGYEYRQQFLYDQLQNLTRIFSIDVIGFSLMDNHMHVLVWTDPDRARAWSDREVAERWLDLCPRSQPAGKSKDEYLAELVKNRKRIGELRPRLASLSWFMKYLKEPLARMANLDDGVTGHFWEGRFKSIHVVDEAGIYTCMAYIDLNPIRAGKAETPEKSLFTSIKERIDAIARQQAEHDAKEAKARLRKGKKPRNTSKTKPKKTSSTATKRLRQPSWLVPFGTGAGRVLNMTIESYLEFVDALGRVVRGDKRGAIPAAAKPILERLGLDPGRVSATMRKLTKRLRGTTVGDAESRAEEALRRGRQHVVAPL